MKKILFITHETSRTGAPLVLLNFLQWLSNQRILFQVSVLALKIGDLADEFKLAAHEYYLYPQTNRNQKDLENLKLKFFSKVGLKRNKLNEKEQFIEKLAKNEFEIIYANTVASIPVAHSIKLRSLNSKILVHCHELDLQINLILPQLRSFSAEIDGFIAVSHLVKKRLNESYEIPFSKIEVIYSFTQMPQIKKQTDSGPFIVGGAGTVDWPKRSDIFIQVAYDIKKRYSHYNILFVWVGYLSDLNKMLINSDLKKAGLEDMVFFKGEMEDPNREFSKMDVFLLTSREESFSLVSAEVGMLSIPIICFEGVSGVSELIKNGGGKIVPYLDVSEMVKEVIEYYENFEQLAKDGEIARRIFSQYTTQIKAPEILKYLNSHL